MKVANPAGGSGSVAFWVPSKAAVWTMCLGRCAFPAGDGSTQNLRSAAARQKPPSGERVIVGRLAGLVGHAQVVVIAGKGYDERALINAIESRGAEAVIPTQRNRAELRAVDRNLYQEGNVCERRWLKVKPYRRVATRYHKKVANFLAFAKVVALVVMPK